MTSIKPIISESERLLLEASRYFKLKIDPSKEITLLIQSRGMKKNAGGWFLNNAWETQEVDNEVGDMGDGEVITVPFITHEITLCAEVLKQADVGMILLHELAHAENHKLGIRDVDKTCVRHNKKFKDMAERLGLIVENHKRLGWALTTAGSKATEFLESIKFDRSLFELFRLEGGRREPKGSRMIKIVCLDERDKGCTFVCRASQKCIDLGLPTCGCGSGMEVEEKEGDEE